MKISGPKGPGPIKPPTEPTAKEGAKAEGPSFKEVLEGQPTQAAEGTPGTPMATSIAEVTAKLKAGEVNGPEAIEMLIEAVVRQAVGGALPAIKERMRAAIRRYVEEDPVLSARIKELDRGDQS